MVDGIVWRAARTSARRDLPTRLSVREWWEKTLDETANSRPHGTSREPESAQIMPWKQRGIARDSMKIWVARWPRQEGQRTAPVLTRREGRKAYSQ